MLQLIENCEGKTIDNIIVELDQEYQRVVRHLEVDTVPERLKAELMLLQAEKVSDLENRVEEDNDHSNDIAAEITGMLAQKQKKLDTLSNQVGKSSKLAMLKKVSNAVIVDGDNNTSTHATNLSIGRN